VEIPGVSNMYFLKAALNTIRKSRGLEELDAMDFLTMVKEKLALVEMDEPGDRFLDASINVAREPRFARGLELQLRTRHGPRRSVFGRWQRKRLCGLGSPRSPRIERVSVLAL
jgi:hypothetical protein